MKILNIDLKISIREIARDIKKNLFVSFVLILQCIICFTLLSIVVANAYFAHLDTYPLKEVAEKDRYVLIDNVGTGMSLGEYENSIMEYKKLYGFVNELRSLESIEFINVVRQPILVAIQSHNIPDKFMFQYEEGSPISPEIINGIKHIDVKSVQVSQNVFKEFGVEVDTGRGFSDTDYILEDNKISVILGSEYKDIFSVGDIFEGHYLSDEAMYFEVAGFLPQDTYILQNGNILYLDRYVVLPAFKEYNYEKFQDIAQFALLQQSNGVIVSNDPDLNVTKLVNSLSDKYGTLKFEVHAIDSTQLFNLVNISREVVKKLAIVSVIVTIFTVIGITVTILSRIRENYYRYGVHLICGATSDYIFVEMVGLILFIIFSAFFVSLPFSLILTGLGIQQLIVFIVALVISALVSLPAFIAIKNIKVSQLIRRKE
ncbi:hypothetical protein PRVXT_002725 [Proteinivorax tanatarense]|uniref:Uncharacterized protein n=1 Tax=Proteinivorax tanatarense TaxID=1260629 RepID=A0AAU7VLD7_9FIRM